MALTYDGTGGLFTRLGALIYMMDAVRTHQANLKTLLANVQAEYSSTDAWMIDILSGNIENRIKEAGGVLDDVRTAAEKTLIEMCFAEANLSTAENTMVQKEIRSALIWLIRQMDDDGETIDGSTINKTGLTTGGSNSGNGTFLYNFTAPNILVGTTNEWPNIRSEVIEVRCVQDASNNAISRGSEVFEVRGQPSYANLDYRFPAGSGTRMMLTTMCASIDNGPVGQNILNNSDFEDQTSNLPAQFTLSSGTAGTEFLTETTSVYRGSSAVKMAVTGSTFKIRQQLGAFEGTLGRLNSDRSYVIAVAMKKDAGATGTFRISVQDGSGTIIDSGAFALTKDISTLSTSFAIVSTTLRAPRVIPTDVYLVIETTVAVGTAAAYFDEVILAEMVNIAPGGPSLAVIAGSTNWSADDFARYYFTNNGEGAFATAFDRLFDMYNKGLSLPPNYLGTETISDTLIA